MFSSLHDLENPVSFIFPHYELLFKVLKLFDYSICPLKRYEYIEGN